MLRQEVQLIGRGLERQLVQLLLRGARRLEGTLKKKKSVRDKCEAGQERRWAENGEGPPVSVNLKSAHSGRLPLHGARSCPSLPLRALSPDEAEILSSFLSFAGGQTQTFVRCQSSPTP